MASRVCLIHYHEVGLKGKNRSHFEHILMDSIKAALAAFSVSCVTRISGHLLVTFSRPGEAERAFPVLLRIPGVARVSLAYHTNREPHEYCRAAVAALRECEPYQTFKVQAKRSNTDYPLTSLELNAQVGEVLCEAFPEKTVRMHAPDVIVHVLVVQGSVYVYARSERGVGGLPVGSAARLSRYFPRVLTHRWQPGCSRAVELSASPFTSRDVPKLPIRARCFAKTSSRRTHQLFRSDVCTLCPLEIASVRFRLRARAICA